ncbi:LPP20 family lipoprotein [Chitiniphilus purpureus]|uniref:LPP20 family lipoprotein n=1 Tax=Chitiniphilus purpureus TaxID=2981137 RepID=A0ABY6DLS9_9NEIS|nr:LPP20 family lipoprotein [Chitiniphilus sp. CD1]UXY15322.1 LPP20 family lipoprotein [Chitiniphilus sp. CD1]
MILRSVVAFCCLLLTGCTGLSKSQTGEAAPPVVVPQVITVLGHAAPPAGNELTAAQKRLMALRASRLDAYRALAEMVWGVRLSGQSTVAQMAMQQDRLRVFVEGYLRGARVVSSRELADGSFETQVELTLAPEFIRTLAGGETVVTAAPVAVEPEPARPAPAPAQTTPLQPVSAQADLRNFYYAQ